MGEWARKTRESEEDKEDEEDKTSKTGARADWTDLLSRVFGSRHGEPCVQSTSLHSCPASSLTHRCFEVCLHFHRGPG